MSDQPTTPGYGESEPASLAAGDFEAESLEASEPTTYLDGDPPADETTEAPVDETAAPEPPHNPVFPVLVGGLLLAFMVVGAILNLEQAKPSVAATTAPSAAPEPAKEPADPTKALAASVDALRSELGGLSKQINELQGRIESTTKQEIHPLQSKIETLTRSTEGLAAIPAKMAALDSRLNVVDGRVASVDKTVTAGLGSLRQELAGLKSDVKRVGQTADEAARLASEKPAPTATATAPVRNTAAPAAEPAVVDEQKTVASLAALYKAGKYKEAASAYVADEAGDPKDARFWYYAALSQGAATSDWKGEAERLVKKGIQREKAGTPSASEIDTEFASLPAGVKPWLDYYRKEAK